MTISDETRVALGVPRFLSARAPGAIHRRPDMAQNRMRRIIVHWTAGGSRASGLDRKHYHRMVEGDGTIIHGTEAIEDNIVTSDGDYAAHTLRLNTGSIGVALCGMRDAIEQPFSPGPSPITAEQFLAACRLIAELAREHSIPVTRETILTHAEVEPTLGVKQRGKWDIARLPFKPDLRGAIPVGDYMRELVSSHVGAAIPASEPSRPTLRIGDRGVAVAELQTDLAGLGYFSGRLDGAFGPLTRAALLAFQADQALATDGVAGPATWGALATSEPRPARQVTLEEIDAESGTAADARMTARVGDLVGAGSLVTLGAKVLERPEGAERAIGLLERVGVLLSHNWPLVALAVGGVLAWALLRGLSISTRLRRLRDAREHRSLAR